MLGTLHLIRDVALALAAVIALTVAALVAIDYGAALIVLVGGLSLVALAIAVVAIYEEEHDLPFNRRR